MSESKRRALLSWWVARLGPWFEAVGIALRIVGRIGVYASWSGRAVSESGVLTLRDQALVSLSLL